MNKKIVIMAAFAAVFGMTAMSCSNEDEKGGNQPSVSQLKSVGFDVSTNGMSATRGLPTTPANYTTQITNFRVWAYDVNTNGIFMGTTTTGILVSKDGDSWSYTPKSYWPLNHLNFVAITPQQDTSITGTTTATTGGTTTAAGTTTLTANVTVPTTVANQKDIMFAAAANASADDHDGDVQLTFKHGLSQIGFSGILDATSNITKADVYGVSVCKVKPTGAIAFTSANAFSTTASGADTEYASVIAPKTGETFAEVNSSSDAIALTQANDALMLIAQSVVGTGGEGSQTAPSTGCYIKVNADLWSNSVKILDHATDVYIPMPNTGAGSNWVEGKKYTYQIKFTGKALTPIEFDVIGVTDWDPVNGGTVVL